MKLSKMLLAVFLTATVAFTSCKPKDADIKTAIETKINNIPELSGTTVTVTDGVATINGELKSEADKLRIAAFQKDIKGLKSVIDNTTVMAPVIPEIEITADDMLNRAVADATKDFKGVVAAVNDGVISLTGEISRSSLPKLMMALNALKPKKIDNKLTIK